VWIDTNGNGIQDSDELANSFAAGVIVELHDTTTNALVKPQKQSSSTGLYLFNSVPVGTYRIFATNLPK
jgi:hypothetical protein